MQTMQTIQLTEAQVKELDEGGVVDLPASWDEFMAFLSETTYRAEYHNGRIIVMGLATFIHELLVGNLIALLKAVTKGTNFYVAGSNVGVMKADQSGYYNPDVTVVQGPPAFAADSRSIITNPFLLVEIFSESTAAYDYLHKLPKYVQIESIQAVVFVDPFASSVIVAERGEQPTVWTHTHYLNLTDLAKVGAFELPLKEIFADLPAV